ncbi:AAEL001727-PA [Aedes aegypti]|uniref:AAEL001727-PA n=1 Tax=Aedes aegypti TaxID=7159 RepID=Q17KD6_AEDAE|nr:AAEL001727-PA [Aedes aegypti]
MASRNFFGAKAQASILPLRAIFHTTIRQLASQLGGKHADETSPICAAAASSRILRHTNSKRSSSSSPNDYSDSATGSLVKEQHHRHQQQQQINGKYLNSNENGGSEDSAGIETPAGATLFSSSASSSLSSSLSSPLSHNSPQTLTLTADKNKTSKCLFRAAGDAKIVPVVYIHHENSSLDIHSTSMVKIHALLQCVQPVLLPLLNQIPYNEAPTYIHSLVIRIRSEAYMCGTNLFYE